ncbi:hypothetical protein BCY84_05072 [Trypanosoma cruzi cruzi]|nr:hypothetical protein BCY84_05072 [Trypanosoma cruzi cruzi]
MDGFSLLPFNCFLLRSSCEGCRVFPAQLLRPHTHRHAHDDGPVRLACCTHEEGRDVWVCDEGLWGGAHISFPLVLFPCGQGGQTPAAPHTHTRSHTLPLFKGIFRALRVYFTRRHFFQGRSRGHFFPRCFVFLCCAHSPDGETRVPSCFFLLLSPPHTRRVTVRCGPPSRADERAEGSSNAQMTP